MASRIVIALLAFLFATPALAASGTIVVKDANGVTRTFDIVVDASGNYIWNNAVCDGSNAAQCAAVKAASTAAVATDPAAVVAISPNNTVAVTESGSWTVAATQSGNWSMRLQDGSGNAITSSTRGAQQALSIQVLDGSGNQVTAFGGSGGTASNFASAFPSIGTAIGVKNGSNMVNLTADGSNNLNVNCTVGCGGSTPDQTAFVYGTTPYVPIGGVYNATITNLSSGTAGAVAMTPARSMHVLEDNSSSILSAINGPVPNPNSAAGWGLLAQGSTTSGQIGQMAMGAVTTAAPTYTTAQTSPLSLDTSGNLRVNVVAGGGSGGTSSTFGATFPSTGTAIGAKFSGNMVNLAADGSNNLLVNPGTITTWGLQASTQNSSTPSNGQLVLGQFNTTPTTITSGNVSPLQMDNAGNLLVNIKAGAAAGGTSITDNTTFTQGTTSFTPVGCLYNTSITNIPSGDAGAFRCTNDRSLVVTVENVNANGLATMANSSPTVIASDQTGPCTGVINVSQTTSTDLKTSTNKLNICSVVLISATAQNIALVEGTGTVCASSTAGLIGGTSASMALAANGGISSVAGLPWLKTQTTADHLCLLQSGSGNISGVITYLDHS